MELIVEGDTTISTTAMVIATEERRAGLLKTTPRTFQVYHRICPHKRFGFSDKHKRSYTMTCMRHIRSCRHKRTACDFNYMLRVYRTKLMLKHKHKVRCKEMVGQSNNRPQIETGRTPSTNHLSQPHFVPTCTTIRCSTHLGIRLPVQILHRRP